MIKKYVLTLCVTVISLFSLCATATSIVQLDFATLTVSSELIFEGQVTNVETRWNDRETDIYTYVSFSVDEVVKGEFEGQQLELRFSGGQVADQTIVYEGLIYPKVGESGIYFVETLSRPLINPLVGWSQGHYKVVGSQVMTNQDQPVTAIDQSAKAKAGALSDGAVSGMSVGSFSAIGMNGAEFKNQIRAVLNK